ncbi:hypothetical protein [Streptococcus suis]|nr:hypothetical protein [Streptococcus suis]
MTAKKENHSTSNTSIQISKVKPLPLQKLDNLNFYQLNARSLKSLQQSQIPYSQDNHLTLAIDKWQVSFNQYQQAINQDKGKELTKKIQEANQLRNSDFSIFKRSLAAFETSKRQTEKSAYTELTQIV